MINLEPNNERHEATVKVSREINTAAPVVLDTPREVEEGPQLVASIFTTRKRQFETVSSDERFDLVDLRSAPRDMDGNTLYNNQALAPNIIFLLKQGEPDWDKGTGYKGIRPGETVTIGRKNELSDRFRLDQQVSRDHFSITVGLDGETVLIEDKNSKNGTSYIDHPAEAVADVETGLEKSDMAAVHELAHVALELSARTEPLHETDSKDPRYKLLFEPIVRPTIAPSKYNRYDILFTEEGSLERAELRRLYDEEDAQNAPLKKQIELYDRYVTDQTRQAARDYLSRAVKYDTTLAQRIKQYTRSDNITTDTVDLLRSNEEARYDIGTYLVEKVNKLVQAHPEAFENRLLMNRQKNPDAKVLPLSYVSSREYAAYLALAMIDGSFNGDRTSAGDLDGEQGQHRKAAYVTLNSPAI